VGVNGDFAFHEIFLKYHARAAEQGRIESGKWRIKGQRADSCCSLPFPGKTSIETARTGGKTMENGELRMEN
jgi:hypothetical protein